MDEDEEEVNDSHGDVEAAVHLLRGVLDVPKGVVGLLRIFIQTVPRVSLIKTRTNFSGWFNILVVSQ